MDSFEDKIAVVTGGGTGMGREIARQLAVAGCHVAMCDVSEENMAQTKALCEEDSTADVRITTHLADVSDEAQRFVADPDASPAGRRAADFDPDASSANDPSAGQTIVRVSDRLVDLYA